MASTGFAACTSTIGAVGEHALQLVGRADRGEAAAVDDRDAVAVLRLVEIVRRDEHRHARRREVIDEAPELAAGQRIDAAGRLVEKDDRRLVQDGAAEREALAPAAGQIGRVRVLAAARARPSRARSGGAPPAASRSRP